MRDIVRSLCMFMAKKKNSISGTFDIDCQLKSIPIQLLTLGNLLIDGPVCTTVIQAPSSIVQLIFSYFKLAPGRNATAFRRDNFDYEVPSKLYNFLKMISDARPNKLEENSHSNLSKLSIT